MTRRELTDGEKTVLRLVQSQFGQRITDEEVKIHRRDEAVIWARDDTGSMMMMVNLTNLAAWLADGTISGKQELPEEWLSIDDR